MTAKDREATASYPNPRCFDSLTEANEVNEVNEDLVNRSQQATESAGGPLSEGSVTCERQVRE
jgi:hypothetical protein